MNWKERLKWLAEERKQKQKDRKGNRLRSLRRDIARMMTILRESEKTTVKEGAE